MGLSINMEIKEQQNINTNKKLNLIIKVLMACNAQSEQGVDDTVFRADTYDGE